ncbi:MAG: MBL fold metallo-hydrolase [Phreatobacter sp.]|uniref:MBL fold metallo-hydrolase n=1 Tax=Phreatobacter sp. TaxID=1966341 RepID=UPI001A498860|nr:MBL fold metallo-hydrolase [Phreatobacter sp.]MBL8571839.1 MBL fold metallo-hydrolase [Phreatobacter sp.]
MTLRPVLLLVAILLSALADRAAAVCLRNVAGVPGAERLASLAPVALERGEVQVTYVGHSTFLIESAEGVRVATDYNDYVRARVTPHIVTMNIAHSTHYSRSIEPGVVHVLEGWGSPQKPAEHDLVYGDVQVRNVPTNIREGMGTAYNGNSIFVFETAGLCIAHLGHLHHRLTPEHLKQLGHIDIMFVPVDGTWTLGAQEMVEVIEQVGPQVIVPMHYFGEMTLLGFTERVVSHPRLGYQVRLNEGPSTVFSRGTLPAAREILILRPQRG